MAKTRYQKSDTHTYSLEGFTDNTLALMRHGYDIAHLRIEPVASIPANTNHQAEDSEIDEILEFLADCLHGLSSKEYSQNHARLLAKNPGYIPEDDES